MKVLKKFEFTNSRQRIQYQEAWFTGETIKLTADDLGPGAMTGKVQSLRKHALDNYSKKLQAQVVAEDDGSESLVIRAY